MIDHFKSTIDPQTEAVLYFYFEESASQDVRMGLLRQVLCSTGGKHILDDIAEIYDKCFKQLTNEKYGIIDRFESYFYSWSSRFSRIYIVIDGLDEYRDMYYRSHWLVNFLVGLLYKEPCWKIVCTARLDFAISNPTARFSTLEIEPRSPDLGDYIKWRVENEWRWRNHKYLKAMVVRKVIAQKNCR